MNIKTIAGFVALLSTAHVATAQIPLIVKSNDKETADTFLIYNPYGTVFNVKTNTEDFHNTNPINDNPPDDIISDDELLKITAKNCTLLKGEIYSQIVFPTYHNHNRQEDGLYNYIQQNLSNDLKNNKDHGVVVVEFNLGANGAVVQPRIYKSISPSADKEAIRLIANMGNWLVVETKHHNYHRFRYRILIKV